jgi:nicotinamidase/pyrazinamidase
MIIDVQNDFTEGGALAVAGGTRVAQGISRLLHESPSYDVVIASRDWHDAEGDNGGHFALAQDPDFVVTWPVHCVAETPGAAYHPDLDAGAIDVHVIKGMGRPAYSLFEGVTASGEEVVPMLDRLGIDEVDVVGLATDYCVRASALDALAAGRAVRVLDDLVAGVAPESSRAALDEIRQAGGVVTPSA